MAKEEMTHLTHSTKTEKETGTSEKGHFYNKIGLLESFAIMNH